jgi:hypothetical protein
MLAHGCGCEKGKGKSGGSMHRLRKSSKQALSKCDSSSHAAFRLHSALAHAGPAAEELSPLLLGLLN